MAIFNSYVKLPEGNSLERGDFKQPQFGDSEIGIWGSLNAINKYHLGIPFSHGNIRDGLVVGFNTLCFQPRKPISG